MITLVLLLKGFLATWRNLCGQTIKIIIEEIQGELEKEREAPWPKEGKVTDKVRKETVRSSSKEEDS
jgi:hypothetical protein